MEKITPCLWFNGKAEEAARFYTSIFKNSRIVTVTRYGEAGAQVSGMPKGSVMTVIFEINRQEFMGLNGGPHFTFSPAISFAVNCETQQEVDEYWRKLSEGGEPGQCGWLTDKYGVSWQIAPTIMGKLFQGKDTAKTENVMKAMLQMQKLDIKVLQQAYDQGQRERIGKGTV